MENLIEVLGMLGFLSVGFAFGLISQLGRIWAQKEEIVALAEANDSLENEVHSLRRTLLDEFDVNASQKEDIEYLREKLRDSFEESNVWFSLAVWLGKALLHARSDEE